MKFTFTFSNLPDIKAKTTAKIKTSIKLPDEIVHLIGVEERIREIGKQVGTLTRSSLHITCKELGIKDELMNDSSFGDVDKIILPMQFALILYFSRARNKRRTLRIMYPINPQEIGMPDVFIRDCHRKRGKGGKSLVNNLKQFTDSWVKTEEQRNYFASIQSINQQLDVLLNTDPKTRNRWFWQLQGFHPFWHDESIRNLVIKEGTRLWDLENKPATPKKSKKHGMGNRVGAIPGKFMGIQFRSQLEIRLATELQQRGIEWIYEEERLGGGNYLVDFHLPEHKAWVEAKGKFEARDHYLLKEVAEVLLERGEKLYVYTSGKAMIVTPDEFIAIPRKEFWMLVENGR